MFISGDGKSHYIRNKLQMCSFQVAIPVNESFSPLSVITRLRLLPLNTEASESEVYGIFFNFTICYPNVSSMCELVNWVCTHIHKQVCKTFAKKCGGM